MSYHLSVCAPRNSLPQAETTQVRPDNGGNQDGFLGSDTQEENEAAADETPGCQLQWQGLLDVLALAPQEILPSLSTPFLPLLCHTDVCVLRSLRQSALPGSPLWLIWAKHHNSNR